MAKKKRKAKRKSQRNAAPKTFKRVTKSSGWISAQAVRFVKRRGKPVQVLVRKPRKKRSRR